MTGHKQARIFRDKNKLIKQFAEDYKCAVSET